MCGRDGDIVGVHAEQIVKEFYENGIRSATGIRATRAGHCLNVVLVKLFIAFGLQTTFSNAWFGNKEHRLAHALAKSRVGVANNLDLLFAANKRQMFIWFCIACGDGLGLDHAVHGDGIFLPFTFTGSMATKSKAWRVRLYVYELTKVSPLTASDSIRDAKLTVSPMTVYCIF